MGKFYWDKPRHISFIMSGNRTWGKLNGKSSERSHRIGAENMEKVAQYCFNKGVKTVSFWAMSTENFKRRPPEEIKNLMKMADDYSKKYEKRDDARLLVLGDLSKLKPETRERCERAMKNTRGKENALAIFFNYGGHQEIIHATKQLIKSGINPEEITEEEFSKHLFTANIDQVDLIVRTGGEQRLSGYLSWQSSYAELYFTKTLWPEMDGKEIDKALEFFNSTKRNFGR